MKIKYHWKPSPFFFQSTVCYCTPRIIKTRGFNGDLSWCIYLHLLSIFRKCLFLIFVFEQQQFFINETDSWYKLQKVKSAFMLSYVELKMRSVSRIHPPSLCQPASICNTCCSDISWSGGLCCVLCSCVYFCLFCAKCVCTLLVLCRVTETLLLLSVTPEVAGKYPSDRKRAALCGITWEHCSWMVSCNIHKAVVIHKNELIHYIPSFCRSLFVCPFLWCVSGYCKHSCKVSTFIRLSISCAWSEAQQY